MSRQRELRVLKLVAEHRLPGTRHDFTVRTKPDKAVSGFWTSRRIAFRRAARSAFLVILQVERRHCLIEELRATAPRRISGSSLAGRLGVSVRTIERDLAELVDAGVPICVQRGHGGGYLLEMGGPPVAIRFSAGEVAALVVSLVAVGPYSSATALSAPDNLRPVPRNAGTGARAGARPRPSSAHPPQSTATARAAQTSRIRSSLSAPNRSTSTTTETLSTESRFTALRFGTGSSPGSSTTSLWSPRMFVVHGATRVRRSRGMAASRESTTTGRRPMSASSDHHTSPRLGRGVTTRRLLRGTTGGHPTRRARRAGAPRRLRRPRRSQRLDIGQAALGAPRRAAPRRWRRGVGFGPPPRARHRRLYLPEPLSWHDDATYVPLTQVKRWSDARLQASADRQASAIAKGRPIQRSCPDVAAPVTAAPRHALLSGRMSTLDRRGPTRLLRSDGQEIPWRRCEREALRRHGTAAKWSPGARSTW